VSGVPGACPAWHAMTKQWEKYRDIIIAEYKSQNKPLHEVQRVMKERYGFRASYV
jgi:hypothetical protein